MDILISSKITNLVVQVTIFCYLISSTRCSSWNVSDASLPLINENYHLAPAPYNISTINKKPSDKQIPRNVWIAVRSAKDPIPANILDLIARNPDWSFHTCDNQCKDQFMEYAFANTSMLWAYNILNPNLGTAKAELWRLAVLFVHGGAYMDDDSTVKSLFDEIIEPGDKFIIAKEAYDYDDRCYNSSYPLSHAGMERRFGQRAKTPFFDNKFFLNWLMFSEVGHPLLLRVFQHIVAFIKSEFLGQPIIKMTKNEAQGKLLQCVSTYSIVSTARELTLEDTPNMGLRVCDHNYKEYGGQMKAWYSDYKPDHWVKAMNQHHIKYLRAYLSSYVDAISKLQHEGDVIMTHGNRQVYLIDKGQKRAFPDLSTFVYMKLDFDNVTTISHDEWNAIPTGPDIPHHD